MDPKRSQTRMQGPVVHFRRLRNQSVASPKASRHKSLSTKYATGLIGGPSGVDGRNPSNDSRNPSNSVEKRKKPLCFLEAIRMLSSVLANPTGCQESWLGLDQIAAWGLHSSSHG